MASKGSTSGTVTVVEESKEVVDNLADKDVDSTDSELRYMAYGARLRTALRAGHRYIAYVRSPSCCVARSINGFTLD